MFLKFSFDNAWVSGDADAKKIAHVLPGIDMLLEKYRNRLAFPPLLKYQISAFTNARRLVWQPKEDFLRGVRIDFMRFEASTYNPTANLRQIRLERATEFSVDLFSGVTLFELEGHF
jgi:hypothetical protein